MPSWQIWGKEADMVNQSCNECELQSVCPKAEHFENYSLDGCYQFKPKTVEEEATSQSDD